MATNQRTSQKKHNPYVSIFNDKRIAFDAFCRSATSAVPVEVTLDELKSQARALWATDEMGAEMTAELPVLVYKLNGETVVLSNWPKVQEFLEKNSNLPNGVKPGVLKARLVSKQLLKHIETVSIPADKQNEKASAVERDIEASHQADWNRDEQQRFGERPRHPYQPREQRQDFGNRQFPARQPQRRPG